MERSQGAGRGAVGEAEVEEASPQSSAEGPLQDRKLNAQGVSFPGRGALLGSTSWTSLCNSKDDTSHSSHLRPLLPVPLLLCGVLALLLMVVPAAV